MLYFVLQPSTVRAAGQCRRIRAACFGLARWLPANRHCRMQEGGRWGARLSPPLFRDTGARCRRAREAGVGRRASLEPGAAAGSGEP